ncbi:MAG: carboxypeptidase-like regulatory domain-containing protein, partial [Firmicutes bacterium]|nr:carboxypeptidase-like regulatory domain-containing protein [Bacillota bacterium]
AVTIRGEICGSTRIRRPKGLADYGGLELELLNTEGKRIKLFRSAFDGYFELHDLPIGRYTLQVSPAEVERLKIKAPPARQINVTTQTSLFEGQDLVIEP